MNRLFKALSHPVRRRILLSLRDRNERDTAELASIRSELHLHHNHLPCLDDAGLIEWQRERNVVRLGARFDESRPILDWIEAQCEDSRDDTP
ncbi:MAG: ArsR/SmtB family transcription factor [Salinigranum sp.]